MTRITRSKFLDCVPSDESPLNVVEASPSSAVVALLHLQAEVGDLHARVPFLLKDVPPRGKLLVALRRQDDYAGQHLI